MFSSSSTSMADDSSRSSSSFMLTRSSSSAQLTYSNNRFKSLAKSEPLPDPSTLMRVASEVLSSSYSSEEVSAPSRASPLPKITLTSSSPKTYRDGRKVLKTSLTVLYRFGPKNIKEKEVIEEEGISEDFINKYNSLFGDKAQHHKAERLSKNMRQLAGLDPSENAPDVSEARIGLCLLAALKDEKLKMEALNSLEELLSSDPKTPETAANLITFASNFFNLVTRKEFKEESPQTQKKLDAIYDILIPLLQEQYKIGNIGPITPDLKSHLTIAAIELGKVSSQSVFEQQDYAIDIPSARLDLCRNISDPDDKAKSDALTSLEYILKNDPCTPETASHLVELAINYLTIINKEEFQKELPYIQTKMVIVYDTLIELLQRQYVNGHIGAITYELKTQFTSASKALERLNTHEDLAFKYHIRCALQGSRRLSDDRQELFAYLNRAFQIIAGIATLASEEADAGFTRIENELSKIDPRLKHTWYDNTLILKNLGRNAFRDMQVLKEALRFIGTKTPKDIKDKKDKNEQRWEFYYTAVETLKEICQKGMTPEIRQLALNGMNNQCPGLAALVGIHTLKEYRDMDKVKLLKRPAKMDPNILVRRRAVEGIGMIILSTADENVKFMAKTLLSKQLVNETDNEVKAHIRSLLPSREALKKRRTHITQ